jgi:hypothetical protein
VIDSCFKVKFNALVLQEVRLLVLQQHQSGFVGV